MNKIVMCMAAILVSSSAFAQVGTTVKEARSRPCYRQLEPTEGRRAAHLMADRFRSPSVRVLVL
jgi:hypothetical protein